MSKSLRRRRRKEMKERKRERKTGVGEDEEAIEGAQKEGAREVTGTKDNSV